MSFSWVIIKWHSITCTWCSHVLSRLLEILALVFPGKWWQQKIKLKCHIKKKLFTEVQVNMKKKTNVLKVFLRVLILGIVGSTGLLITNNKSLIENVRQHNKAVKNIWQNIRIIVDSIKNLYTVFLVDS